MLRTCLFVFGALPVLTILATGAPEDGASFVVLFNGKDTSGWKIKGPSAVNWVVGQAALDEKDPSKLVVKPGDALINPYRPGDRHGELYTEQKFGDGSFELEFMIPKGSNSGVYVMGEYEVQILDSYGKEKPDDKDMGALYGIAAPKVNAAKKHGEWQKYIIEYQAPKFKDGKKVSNFKLVKVTLNGMPILENVEAKGPTLGSLTGKEAATGPLMLQGLWGSAAFRNIRFIPRAVK